MRQPQRRFQHAHQRAPRPALLQLVAGACRLCELTLPTPNTSRSIRSDEAVDRIGDVVEAVVGEAAEPPLLPLAVH